MNNKINTKVSFDIPTVDHKRLKVLAAFEGKSMREILVKIIEQGLDSYQECPKSHEPNVTTKKALEMAKNRTGLEHASSVEELFKKLSS